MKLSPADDTLIRVERVLDLDSQGQLVASVLSKKIAAGATHVIIDLPMGPTAKVRSLKAAQALSQDLKYVAKKLGLKIKVILSDGKQPVGYGIGPARVSSPCFSRACCRRHDGDFAHLSLRQRI